MPPDHGSRLDQHHGVEDLRPDLVKPHPEHPVGGEEPRVAGALPTQGGHWCRRATSSSSSEARLRTRNESREPTADRSAIMPTTVWARRKKRYTWSAVSTFAQAQLSRLDKIFGSDRSNHRLNSIGRQFALSRFTPKLTSKNLKAVLPIYSCHLLRSIPGASMQASGHVSRPNASHSLTKIS
jgi:hypothetical protein